MSPEVQAAEPTPEAAPMTSGDLAASFLAELNAESAPEPKTQPQPEAPVEAAPDIESAPEVEAVQPEQAEPSDQEPATPAIEPPRSMSAEEKALFEQLPPEAKAWLAKREKEAQADYTRKTQEIAEQRRQYEAALPTLMNQLQQYDQILSSFTTRAPVPPDPALRQTDPLTFEDQMAEYIHQKHTYEVAQQEQSRIRQEMNGHQQAVQRQYWAEQQQELQKLAPKLAEQTPEAKKLRADVYEYANKQGYSREQLQQASARDLVTLWKAHQFDQAMSKKPVTPPPVATPKVMAPGPARAPARTNGFAQAVRSLSENPNRAGLANAYLAELNAER